MDTTEQYPEDKTVSHDLDPNGGDGNLTRTVRVGKQQALIVAGNSTDNNDWSASVRWVDGDDNEFVSESKTDIKLDTVSNDWARLTRKAPKAEVTFTSEETAGTQNRINAFVDAHR